MEERAVRPNPNALFHLWQPTSFFFLPAFTYSIIFRYTSSLLDTNIRAIMEQRFFELSSLLGLSSLLMTL
jgi:hypothetical protein